MRSLLSIVATAATFATILLGSSVVASPAPQAAAAANVEPLVAITSAGQDRIPGKYIVKFKEGRTKSRKEWAGRVGRKSRTRQWENLEGFAAEIDEATLSELMTSKDVESIHEDGVVRAFQTIKQGNAPWGLGRIDQYGRHDAQDPAQLFYGFTYHHTAGQGVDIFVLDSGINIGHVDFGGRARWGPAFVTTTGTDQLGHGTHCAGTAGGARWGVAKKANLISVQVLDKNGNGSLSGLISGMDYVISEARNTGRPSVVSMSLGGGAYQPVDDAVARLTAAGIHVVVAAGNDNINVSNVSPARAPSAITVGSSTIADRKADSSNYGAGVDIWAPGKDVISAWIGSTTATRSMSGTSMAAPHVAGAVAYFIARDGNISPAAMASKLKSLSHKNALSGIPSGTVNELLHTN